MKKLTFIFQKYSKNIDVKGTVCFIYLVHHSFSSSNYEYYVNLNTESQREKSVRSLSYFCLKNARINKEKVRSLDPQWILESLYLMSLLTDTLLHSKYYKLDSFGSFKIKDWIHEYPTRLLITQRKYRDSM